MSFHLLIGISSRGICIQTSIPWRQTYGKCNSVNRTWVVVLRLVPPGLHGLNTQVKHSPFRKNTSTVVAVPKKPKWWRMFVSVYWQIMWQNLWNPSVFYGALTLDVSQGASNQMGISAPFGENICSPFSLLYRLYLSWLKIDLMAWWTHLIWLLQAQFGGL